MRRELIPQSVLFRGMRPWQIRRFILASNLVEYGQGQAVFEPGDYGSSMYLVMKGEVEVHVPGKGKDSEKLVVSRFGPAELFGDVAALANERRKTRAVVVKQTTLLELNRENLYNVIHYHPFVASRIFYNLAIDVSCRWIRFIGRVQSSEAPAGSTEAEASPESEASRCGPVK